MKFYASFMVAHECKVEMDRKHGAIWRIQGGIGRDRQREGDRRWKVQWYIPAQLSTMCTLCMPIEATEMCIGTLVARQCSRAESNCFHDTVHQLNFQPDLTWLDDELLLVLAEWIVWCLGMRCVAQQYFPIQTREIKKIKKREKKKWKFNQFSSTSSWCVTNVAYINNNFFPNQETEQK